MRKHYTKIKAGPDGWTKWIKPKPKGYKMACCDCALVHVLEFKAIKERVLIRVRRAPLLTKIARKMMGIVVRTTPK